MSDLSRQRDVHAAPSAPVAALALSPQGLGATLRDLGDDDLAAIIAQFRRQGLLRVTSLFLMIASVFAIDAFVPFPALGRLALLYLVPLATAVSVEGWVRWRFRRRLVLLGLSPDAFAELRRRLQRASVPARFPPPSVDELLRLVRAQQGEDPEPPQRP